MANEIQTTITINVAKNGVVAALSKLIQANLSGNKIVATVQNVSSTAEDIFLGEITDPQFICLVNLSGTDAVDLILGGVECGILLPDGGGINWLFFQPFAGITKQLASEGDPCDVMVIAAL